MSALRPVRHQVAYEEALRRLEKKSDEEVKREFYRDQATILDSPLRDHIYPSYLPPPSFSPSSPEEEAQEKERYRKKVQQGLALVLDPEVKATERYARLVSPKSKDYRDTLVQMFSTHALPDTREWQTFTKRVIHAWVLSARYQDTELWIDLGEHMGAIAKANGNEREYVAFLWLLSILGAVGSYQCRRGGWTTGDGKRARVQSVSEFLSFLKKRRFKRRAETDGQKRLAQRNTAKSKEAEKRAREDEQFAKEFLPLLFHIDCTFFLQRPWVRELLADWHDKGEEDAISHAFFSRPRCKKETHYGPMRDFIARDEKLAAAVTFLMEEKSFTPSQAIDAVGTGKSWMVTGQGAPRGTSTTRQAYYNTKSPVHPQLRRYFTKS